MELPRSEITYLKMIVIEAQDKLHIEFPAREKLLAK